ncbi:caspase family protein [Rhodovulum sp. PH10]|uniref:caspase family protein n=1 Tax=Rhodovulum sp. PH10 TaxID=1187851 RepID=UPI0003170035|nr:caspase family protein [Rhodovulum sp. PH10]
MRRRLFTAALAAVVGGWVTACATLAPAFAETGRAGTGAAEARMALVIGNSAYRAVPALPNPANDARAMAKLLGEAGFEVTEAPDLTQEGMRRAIGTFAAKLAAAGGEPVALVYYAGHGVQIDGENFLVPVDARIEREADVTFQAVRLTDLMNALAAIPSKTRIVMLDACRNNPFSAIGKVTGRGLAIVDAPAGSIVSYSTAPGAEAEDGSGTHSPYTAALLEVAKNPGVPIEQALKRVRWAVHEATDGRQTPWESSSLTANFSFFPEAKAEGGEEKKTADGGAGASEPTDERTRAPASGLTSGPGEPASEPVPRPRPQVLQVADARAPVRSVADWKTELAPLGQPKAYRIVIEQDEVEAYQAYLELFGAEAPYRLTRVREIVERRVVMVDWYHAVITGTPAAFATFIGDHPGIDLIATAERLMARARTRAFNPAPAAVAAVCVAPPVMPAVAPAVAPAAPARAEPRRSRRSERKSTPKREARPHRVIVREEPPPRPVIVPAGPPVIGVMPVRPFRPHVRPHRPHGPHRPPQMGDGPYRPPGGGWRGPRGPRGPFGGMIMRRGGGSFGLR